MEDPPFVGLTQPMDPEKKSLNFIFPTKYVIPKSLKFSHWPSERTHFVFDGQFLESCQCMSVLHIPRHLGTTDIIDLHLTSKKGRLFCVKGFPW